MPPKKQSAKPSAPAKGYPPSEIDLGDIYAGSKRGADYYDASDTHTAAQIRELEHEWDALGKEHDRAQDELRKLQRSKAKDADDRFEAWAEYDQKLKDRITPIEETFFMAVRGETPEGLDKKAKADTAARTQRLNQKKKQGEIIRRWMEQKLAAGYTVNNVVMMAGAWGGLQDTPIALKPGVAKSWKDAGDEFIIVNSAGEVGYAVGRSKGKPRYQFLTFGSMLRASDGDVLPFNENYERWAKDKGIKSPDDLPAPMIAVPSVTTKAKPGDSMVTIREITDHEERMELRMRGDRPDKAKAPAKAPAKEPRAANPYVTKRGTPAKTLTDKDVKDYLTGLGKPVPAKLSSQPEAIEAAVIDADIGFVKTRLLALSKSLDSDEKKLKRARNSNTRQNLEFLVSSSKQSITTLEQELKDNQGRQRALLAGLSSSSRPVAAKSVKAKKGTGLAVPKNDVPETTRG